MFFFMLVMNYKNLENTSYLQGGEAEGSQVRGQPGKLSNTVSQNKIKRIRNGWGYSLVLA